MGAADSAGRVVVPVVAVSVAAMVEVVEVMVVVVLGLKSMPKQLQAEESWGLERPPMLPIGRNHLRLSVDFFLGSASGMAGAGVGAGCLGIMFSARFFRAGLAVAVFWKQVWMFVMVGLIGDGVTVARTLRVLVIGMVRTLVALRVFVVMLNTEVQ